MENELFAQEKLMLVKAHFKYLQLHIYSNKLHQQAFEDERLRPILLDLLRVTALKDLISDSSLLFASGFFAPEAHAQMREALDLVIKRLRPQLLSLAERMMFSDSVLPSSIGNSYGDIYELQFEWAQKSRMQVLDAKDGGPTYFEELIKPFLT